MKRNFTLIIIFTALSLFAQLDMTLAEFSEQLDKNNTLIINSYPTHKVAILKWDDSSNYIRANSINDTIVKCRYAYTNAASFKELKKVLDKYGDWKEVAINPMELAELGYGNQDHEFSNFQKYVNVNETATAYLVLDDELFMYNSVINIRSKKYYELEAKLILEGKDEYIYLSDELEIGYYANSRELLVKIMDGWVEESKPLSLEKRSSIPIINEAYEIFEDVYTPLNLLRFGDPHQRQLDLFEYMGIEFIDMDNIDWNDPDFNTYNKSKNPNLNSNYFVVQDFLKISIVDSFSTKYSASNKMEVLSEITITDFRPTIKHDTIKTVYINPDKIWLLSNFLLGDEHRKDNFTRDEAYYSDLKNRKKYLNQLFYAENRNWSKSNYIDDLMIHKITFNKTLDRAIVLGLSLNGGSVEYRKINEKWQYIRPLYRDSN